MTQKDIQEINEREYFESVMAEEEEKMQEQLDEIQEDTTSMEEKIESIDKLKKIPDMTFWEEQAFENEQQGGKSILDDDIELDDNQY